jgi:1-acyl-sn-glycerol-3-phosphate acyltransferase
VKLYRTLHVIVAPILRLVWRLEVVGTDRVPPGAVIVVANHDSLADPVVLGAAFPRTLRFLSKQELWANRPVGRLLDALGGIPIARARGDVAAVDAAARALASGASVAIFPQGTTRGPADRPWQRGAARLALATGAPLVPVAIAGAADALPPGSRVPRRASLRVVIGEPIIVEPQSPTIPATRELTARLRAAVESLPEP